MTNEAVQIIYLNGPSSSGKTTLAKALQHAFEEPFLHVGIDKIIGWMPEKVNDWTGGEAPVGYSWKKSEDASGNPIQELQAGPYAQKIGKTFQEVLLALAKMGHHIVIDDVSFGKQQLDEWKNSLKDFRVLWVGVNAPLPVLEQREKERGNRIHGSARGQFHKVHVDANYDLEIDTHQASVSENAEKIKSLALCPSNLIEAEKMKVTHCKATKDDSVNIIIRKAEVKDALCIVEAEREIAQEPGYFCSEPSELDEKAVIQTIQSPQSIYLVAEHEGQVVGHAFLETYTLRSLRHVADLNIAVHLGWQKKA